MERDPQKAVRFSRGTAKVERMRLMFGRGWNCYQMWNVESRE